MTTYEAASWQDIYDICSETFTDDVTIKLIADIDCNRAIPEGVESSIELYWTSSSLKYAIIDGSYEVNGVTKNHVIKNLRTHVINPVTIFYAHRKPPSQSDTTAPLRIRNIDFINLILDAPLARGGYSQTPLAITGCRFVGKRSTSMFYGATTGGTVLTSCFFNVPYISSSPSINNIYLATVNSTVTNPRDAYYCYFQESYAGWTVDNTKPCTSFGNLRLSGCYVDGEIVAGETFILTTQYANDSTIQNAINANLYTTAAEGTTISVQAPKGIWKNDIYSTNSAITEPYEYVNVNQDNTTEPPILYAIPESPANMKDANALYDDGFDIVHESGDAT